MYILITHGYPEMCSKYKKIAKVRQITEVNSFIKYLQFWF